MNTNWNNFINQRPSYFPGQYLLEDDFELQHQYLDERQNYHNRSLHLAGIVEGLAVNTSGVKTVTIEPGTAIDSNGKLIVLTTNQQITINSDCWLCLEYNHQKQQQQQKEIPDSFTRFKEIPNILQISLSESPKNNQVVLAKVALVADKVNLDLEVRQYSGIRFPSPNNEDITLRFQNDTKPNQIVLNGSLKITEDFEAKNLTITGKINSNGQSILDASQIAGLEDLQKATSSQNEDLTVNNLTVKQNFTIDSKIQSHNNKILEASQIDGLDSHWEQIANRWNFYTKNNNIGVGIQEPLAVFHVNGDMKIGSESNPNGYLTIFETENGALNIKGAEQYLYFDSNEICYYSDNSNKSYLYLNYNSGKWVQIGSEDTQSGLYVYGNMYVTGDMQISGQKSGYITDRFINQSGDLLEQGDVVTLSKQSVEVYYGKNNNIPVPEVDLTNKAYNSSVCGIVSEILVEQPTQQLDKPKLKTNGETPKVNVKQMQVFSEEEQEQLNLTKIGQGQYGNMVTLGCFAHCKVDADIAAIAVGDLLTTSPTKGHAQKVLDPQKAQGAIIGKALKSLKKGKGKIPVMVMLQ